MPKPPLSPIQIIAQMLKEIRAERAAKIARAQAEYDRITAQLRSRHARIGKIHDLS